MKKQTKRFIKKTLALITAISVTFTMSVFADGWRVGNVTNGDENAPFTVGNYTFLSPTLSGTKLILQDPKLAEKSWVEYVEYSPKPIAEVQEDDIKYYIYQPTDYAISSIMAIRDYNPDEITGSSANLSVSLGELSSIFEAAALGNGVATKLMGSSMSADTIAQEMTSTSDIVKNSKYYATPSFMGIPDDDEYNGVSNNGYYNASSMTISMTKSNSVQVTKTNTSSSSMSVGSSASASTSLSNTRQDTNSRTVSNTNSDTDSKSTSMSNTHTDSSSETNTESSSTTHTDNISSTHETSSSHTSGYSKKQDSGKALSFIGQLVSLIPGLGAIIGVGMQLVGESGILGENNFSQSDQESEKDSTTNGESDSTTEGDSSSSTEGESDSKTESETKGVSSTVSKAISDANTSSNSSSSSSSGTTGTNASSTIGYGLNYAQSQQTSISETVSRTFSSRDDDEVKNVGWKLCQYVVRVPYYVEAVKVNGAEETLIYSQYVTYDLLTGVSRVFANGYIEHWNTGELVTYADFFEGFITAQELVDTAKEQAKDN